MKRDNPNSNREVLRAAVCCQELRFTIMQATRLRVSSKKEEKKKKSRTRPVMGVAQQLFA